MFSIDRFSGKITLAHPLDHERQQQYTLRVQASDMAHVAETSITVNVLDENDNAPAFILQSYHASLPGNHPLEIQRVFFDFDFWFFDFDFYLICIYIYKQGCGI